MPLDNYEPSFQQVTLNSTIPNSTWTVPANVNFIWVTSIGGGSGGQGGAASAGGGGGGGSATFAWLNMGLPVTPGGLLTYTNGLGSSGSNAGSSTAVGGNTTFNTSTFKSLWIAPGGGSNGALTTANGGNGATAPGIAGATTFPINFAAQVGNGGFSAVGNTGMYASAANTQGALVGLYSGGGGGGSSLFAGGPSNQPTGAQVSGGTGPGGGGAGGGSLFGTGGAGGASGGAGSAATGYGAGGGGGGQAGAGGNGSNGCIIVSYIA